MMRAVKRLMLGCALALAAATYWSYYQPNYQRAELTLYERPLGDRFAFVEPPSARSYRATFSTQAKGLWVPLRLTWTAARDSSGCLRVSDVTLRREGGSTALRIDSVTVQYFPCDRNESGALVERASVSAMRWVTGGGARTGFGGNVAEISGGGDFRVERWGR